MHTSHSESTLDGHSIFEYAVIMFVQTQFCGLCSMRAPLHGCSLAGPAGGLANLGEFGGKWQGDFYHTTTPMYLGVVSPDFDRIPVQSVH